MIKCVFEKVKKAERKFDLSVYIYRQNLNISRLFKISSKNSF